MRLQEDIKTKDDVCREQLAAAGKILPFHKGKPLLGQRQDLVWKTFDEAKAANPALEDELCFLRMDESTGAPLFAAPMPEDVAGDDAHFTNIRVTMFSCDESALACHAWSLLQWNRKNSFCANCGGKLRRSNACGHQRSCTACDAVYYPTLSPVGIVLVEATDKSKVLLIRQPRYPPGMYSCIAGFVDTGEALSACVRREVAEEVGVEISESTVGVHSSQHWPFPSGSLMVGCFAQADPSAVPDPLPGEVEDARWFSPEELRDMFERIRGNPSLRGRGTEDALFVPPKNAIAHHLVKAWLLEQGMIEEE